MVTAYHLPCLLKGGVVIMKVIRNF